MANQTSYIKLKSVLNFRDLGGDGSLSGNNMKENVIFRSANPDKITYPDILILQSLNIRTIIDLRAPNEVSKTAVKLVDVQKISLPIDFNQITRERLKPVLKKKNPEDEITMISQSLYLEMLDAALPVFREVMELLVQHDSSPLMIHCQVGKDRTGIISALILLALGANRQAIIDDFMKSNDALMPFFRRSFLKRKILSFGFFPYKAVLFAVTVRRNNIESVIDRVFNHYGGIEGYLASAGFDISQLGDLRKRLCHN
jgi:protein-tyrosine phosphatase